jgi:hypothetical protein
VVLWNGGVCVAHGAIRTGKRVPMELLREEFAGRTALKWRRSDAARRDVATLS